MGWHVVCVLFLCGLYRVCFSGSPRAKEQKRLEAPEQKRAEAGSVTCSSDDSGLKHYLVYIRACAISYAGYYNWKNGDPIIRGYHMHIHKRDWEMAGALYRYYRRWEYINKAAKEYFGKAWE